MHIPRFFLTPNEVCTPANPHVGAARTRESLDLQPGETVSVLQSAIINQVRNVLRLRNGDKVVLLDGTGDIYYCSITSVESSALICLVDQKSKCESDLGPKVIIGLPLLKGDRFEWALQKLCEIGVHAVVPIETARSVVRIDAKGASNKMIRWHNILKEAAEQSERGTIPHIVLPKKIDEFISSFTAGGSSTTAFICAERLSVTPLKDILLDHACSRTDLLGTADKTIFVLVGPEGGLTESEIGTAVERGFMPVSLGRRILRAETAAIISVAQIIWALEN